jgi:hypothetical protein
VSVEVDPTRTFFAIAAVLFTGATVSVSVAELFPGVGSVTPAGTETVAVLARVPVAAALTVPLTVKVTDAAGARLTD